MTGQTSWSRRFCAWIVPIVGSPLAQRSQKLSIADARHYPRAVRGAVTGTEKSDRESKRG